MTKKAEKVDGRQSVIKRDDNGLFPDQVTVLEALAKGIPPQKLGSTEEGVGIAWKRVRRWMREDEAFVLAYDQVFGTTLAGIRRQSEISSEKAMDTLDELTDAMKPIRRSFNCLGCGMCNNVDVVIPDAQVRKAAAETILKISGAMKEISKVEVEVEDITKRPDVWQSLDLMRVQRGIALAPGRFDELVEAGFLEQKDRGSVMEGEYRVVEEEEQDGNDETSDVQYDPGSGVQLPDRDSGSSV